MAAPEDLNGTETADFQRSERLIWVGLIDFATDLLGSAAAGKVVEQAYKADDPEAGYHEIIDHLILSLLDTGDEVTV